MIPPADINAGKVLEIDGRNFCYKCSMALSQEQAPPPSRPPPPRPVPRQTTAARPTSAAQPGKPSGIRPPVAGHPASRPAIPRPSASTPAVRRPGGAPAPAMTKSSPHQKSLSGLKRPQRSQVPVSEENEDFEVVDKKTSSKKYLIGGIVAAVVIVLVVIIIASSGGDDKPIKKKPTRPSTATGNETKTKPSGDNKLPATTDDPKPTDTPIKPPPNNEEALAKAKKAYEEIEEYESKNQLDSGGILKKIKASLSLMANTPYEEQAKKKQKEHDEKEFIIRETKEYYASFEELKNKGETIDYTYYLKNLNELKEKAEKAENNTELNKFVGEQIAKIKEGQKGEIAQKLSELKKKIEELLAQKVFEMAKSECNNFPEEFKNDPDVSGEIKKLVEKINSAEQAYIKEQKEKGKLLYGGDNTDISGWKMAVSPSKMTVLDDKTLSLENVTGQDSYLFLGDPSWENYTVEIEYKVVQGAFNVILRLDSAALEENRPFKDPIEIPLTRKPGDENWKKISLGLEDKTLIIKQDDEAEKKKTISKDSSTKGLLGFKLKNGDKIIIKSIRVKGVE
jgi:hypothetical protein